MLANEALAAGTGTISGYLWMDTDGDGIRGTYPGETPITDSGGVNLVDENGIVVSNVTLNTLGYYEFTGLPAGSYKIAPATVNPAWYPTTIAADSHDPNEFIVLADGATVIDQNYGYFTTASVEALLFDDWNDNNQPDSGEPGVEGYTVTITRTGTRSHHSRLMRPLLVPQAAVGPKIFDGLRPGTYNVTITSPGTPAVSETEPVTTYSGNNYVPFAIEGVFTVGDLVWNDINNNGIQDAEEPGAADVVVNLYTMGAAPCWKPPKLTPTGTGRSDRAAPDNSVSYSSPRRTRSRHQRARAMTPHATRRTSTAACTPLHVRWPPVGRRER